MGNSTMKPSPLSRGLLLVLLSIGFGASSWGQDASNPAPPEPSADGHFPARNAERVTVAEARRQAELLHAAMHSTLQLVHHRYYREDEGLPLPAAIIDQVFTKLEAEQNVKLRWLAVEGQAMNTDHEARDEFEKAAVRALKSGKASYDQVQNGVYRRAGAVTLKNDCLKCHVPDRKSTRDRTAGMTVAIPVRP